MKFSLKSFIIIIKKSFLKFFYAILALAALAILALGYYFIISPKILDIRGGGEISLESKTKQVEELTAHLDSLDAMHGAYSEYSEEKIKTLTSILPAEKDIPGLYVQLQEIASRNNFIMSSIDISDVSAPEGFGGASGEAAPGQENPSDGAKNSDFLRKQILESYGIRELNIYAVISGGSYQDLKSFLGDIEKNLRLFDVFDINFGSVNGGPYSLNIRTYYLSGQGLY